MQLDFTANSLDLGSLDSTRNSFAFSPRKSPMPLPNTPNCKTGTMHGSLTPNSFVCASPQSGRLGSGVMPAHPSSMGYYSHQRKLSFGDRFIPPSREATDVNMSHYLLTSPEVHQMPQHLLGGASSAGAAANAAGSFVANSTASGAIGVGGSLLEAASPSFAGSPNASPNRTNTQNRIPSSANKSDIPALATGPQPYSRSLAKVLFPTASELQPSSVLGFKSSNRPSLLVGDALADDDDDSANNASTAGCTSSSNVSTISKNTIRESERFRQSQGVVYQENRARNFQSKSFRVIPQTPERILDAPELLDDFYLNLLDWSSRNALAVALGSTAYLWNADDGTITQLMTAERDNMITAVSWHGEGNTIAIGLNDGTVQLWDAEQQTLLRSITGHAARVSSISWNGGLLASGSRDTTIRMHDIRDPFVSGAVQGHTQEVCGLRWNINGSQLASGGNDNLLNIWDFRRSAMEVAPLWQLNHHTAAVKALAWNPRQSNLLVSGGGTADKTLRFWDTIRGECVNMVDTLSQVCGVMWSHDGTELVSSHGYSDNQLTLWKYPSLKRLADLTGHTSRVLHLSMSPDGQTVVSAAGDETIRFWRCFAPNTSTASAAANNPFFFSSAAASSPYCHYLSQATGGGCAGAAGSGSPNRQRASGGASSPVGSGATNGILFDDYSCSALR